MESVNRFDMPRILGQIFDSAGKTPLDCFLEVSIEKGFVTTPSGKTNNILVAGEPYIYHAQNGFIDIELPFSNLTFGFRIYKEINIYNFTFSDGEPYRGDVVNHDGDWYSGSEFTENSLLLTRTSTTREVDRISKFYASIPNQEIVQLSDLLPSSISTTNLDTSLLYIVRLLTEREEFASKLRLPIRWMGEYNQFVEYRYGYSASFNGSSYVWRHSTPGNQNPLNSTYWQII